MYYLGITKPVLAIAVYQLRRTVFGVDESIGSAIGKKLVRGFPRGAPLVQLWRRS